MTIMPRILLLGAMLGATLGGFAQLKADALGGARPAISVKIAAPTEVIQVGSSFWVDVTVTNVSDGIVLAPNIDFVVRDSGGALTSRSPAQQTELKQSPRPGSQRGKFLGPAESEESDQDIANTFDLSRPGKYTIQAVANQGAVLVKSNPITVTVTPSGPPREKVEAEGAFTLNISTPTYAVKRGAKLLLKVRLANKTGHENTFDNALTLLDVLVSHDTGNPVTRTDRGEAFKKMHGWSGRDHLIPLQQDEVLRVNLADLNELYDFSRPGRYTIQVQRLDPTTGVVVKSNSIMLTVTD